MVRFELFEAYIEDMPPFMSNGIDVKDKDDVKRITAGHTHETIGFIWGDHTIDFTITDPKDHMTLYELRRLSRELKRTFTIVLFGRDENNELVPVHRLEGCVFVEADRAMKAKEEIKPNLTGYAMRSVPIQTQYA
jgi:formyltetrahydrofolate synthetase